MEIGAVLNFTKCNSALTAQKKHIAQAKFYVKKIPQSCQGNVKISGSIIV